MFELIWKLAVGAVSLCVLVAIVMVCLLALMSLSLAVLNRLARARRHHRTRYTRPETGQLWSSGVVEYSIMGDAGRELYIRKDFSAGSVTWTESRADWARRIKREKLYLVSQ